MNFNLIERMSENLAKTVAVHTYAYRCTHTHTQTIRGDISCLKMCFYWSKVSDEPISSTLRRRQEDMAAKVIQRAFRKGRDTQEKEKPPLEASDSSPLEEA